MPRLIVALLVLVVAGCSSTPAAPAKGVRLVGDPTYTQQSKVGGAAEISFTLINDGADTPPGVSLTFGNSFLEGFELRDANPAWSSSGNVLSLQEIIWGVPNPGKQVAYHVRLVAKKAGTYPLNATIKIDKTQIAAIKGSAVVA